MAAGSAYKLIGTPTEKIWPGFSSLPVAKSFNFRHQPFNNLKLRFPSLTANGIDLMSRLLTYDPAQRISAADALKHPYFSESPVPKDPSLFPTFPSKSAGERRVTNSPGVPYTLHGGEEAMDDEAGELETSSINPQTMQSTQFRLKFM